jgi:hypothetical protein
LKLAPDSTNGLDADGASVSLITFTRSPASALQVVTFTTSAGTLLGENGAQGSSVTASLGSDGKAVVGLRAPTTTGTASLRARSGADVAEAEVPFNRAYPDSLVVDAPRFTVHQNLDSAITLSARLSRHSGKPSPGTSVQFTATRSPTDTTTIGRFSGTTLSDDNGVVTVRFAATPKDTGTFTVTATTRGRTVGSVLTSTIKLSVIP